MLSADKRGDMIQVFYASASISQQDQLKHQNDSVFKVCGERRLLWERQGTRASELC